jgi:hypothetical protein
MRITRIIITLVLAMVSMVGTSMAQTYDVKFDRADMYRTALATPADTVNGTTVIPSKVFWVQKPFKYNYVVQVSADKVASADSTITFSVLGSLDGTKYVSIQTVVWKMTTADTTALITSSATAAYRFIKVQAKGNKTGVRATLKTTHLSLQQ